MNYNEMLINYIDNCPYDEPIFIEDIKDYFRNKIKNNFDKIMKNIYVYINRLVKQNKLFQFSKGIYYKAKKTRLGYKKLNRIKVINKKFIEDKNNIKGYYSGAYLFNELGLSTQMPRERLIITNECPNKNDYENKALGVTIRKPKIEVNEDNYQYLQIIDVLINKDNVNVEVDKDKEREIIYNYIKENSLDFEKLIKYMRKLNTKKPLEKLYELESDDKNE